MRPKPKASSQTNPHLKYLIGVDISLTSTGVGIVDNMGKLVASTFIKTDAKKVDHYRIDFIVEKFFDYVNPYIEPLPFHAVKFMFEGHPFNRHAGKAFTRAEIAGVIKFLLRRSNYDILSCTPTALKKETTGTGRGSGKEGKQAVMDALLVKHNIYVQNDDEADAIACAMYAYRVFVENAALDITRHTTYNRLLHG